MVHLLLNGVVILACITVGIISYIKWVYKYWERLGVPYLEPTFPFGNLQNLFRHKCSFGELIANQYKMGKAKGYKHVGVFGFLRPEYVVIDLEIVKNMLVKDFNYFCDRGFLSDEINDPLSGNLFLLSGDKWRQLRAKLTPTFTSGKMKMMFNILVGCSQDLKSAVDVLCEKGPINAKNFLERYTTDVIGSCAFGLNCNSFNEDDSNFCKMAKRCFEPTALELLKVIIAFFFPTIHKLFRMKDTPADVSAFFLNIVRNSVGYRKTNNVVRNDFLQLLIDLMQGDSGLTIEEVTAQSFVFFAAGSETSSSVMMFALYELSLNQEIQQRLREEVMEVMEHHNDAMSYDCIKDLVYMDQVLDEVMRKYPPLTLFNRICVMDYNLPNYNIVLKKGTRVGVSILAIQNDPEYFPEPEKFDPERFSPKNKEKIKPFSFMPFGEGPRSCIGLRFAFLQMKIALCTLVRNYTFSVNEKTQMPLKMKPGSFILTPVGSIWLNVEKI